VATAQDIIDRARRLINDEETAFASTVQWSDAELLDWITDAQRQIVTLKPEANAVSDVFTPEVGRPRQRLPQASASKIVRVEANTGGIFTFVAGAQTFLAENYVGLQTEFHPGDLDELMGTLTHDSTLLNVIACWVRPDGYLFLVTRQTVSTPLIASIHFTDNTGVQRSLSLVEDDYAWDSDGEGGFYGEYSWFGPAPVYFTEGETYTVAVVR
jgi:hypothetical protein